MEISTNKADENSGFLAGGSKKGNLEGHKNLKCVEEAKMLLPDCSWAAEGHKKQNQCLDEDERRMAQEGIVS